MEKLNKSRAKEYNLVWLADDGEQVRLGSVIIANPKEVLFNKACMMIVTLPTYFKFDKDFNLKKSICTGKTAREHHFLQIGEQYLSIIEAKYDDPSGI